MAKATSRSKTKKRQPAKKRLPSSSIKKKSVKQKPKAKKSIKKRSVRKVAPKRTKPTKKTPVSKTKKLSIKLGRNSSLTITLKFSKPKKSVAKKIRKTKRKLSFEQNLFLSILMIITGLTGIFYAAPRITDASLENDYSLVNAQEAPIEINNQFLAKSKPVSLRVPDVNIETTLTTVGKNSNGTLEVPEDYKVAGWYKHGPTPGEKGPSVIVGHVDNREGLGVFWRLREITPGEIIEIKREDNKMIKFKVNSIKKFSQNSFPTQRVYGNIDHAGLRIITCGGTFNHITHRYSDNIVVFASLIKKDREV